MNRAFSTLGIRSASITIMVLVSSTAWASVIDLGTVGTSPISASYSQTVYHSLTPLPAPTPTLIEDDYSFTVAGSGLRTLRIAGDQGATGALMSFYLASNVAVPALYEDPADPLTRYYQVSDAITYLLSVQRPAPAQNYWSVTGDASYSVTLTPDLYPREYGSTVSLGNVGLGQSHVLSQSGTIYRDLIGTDPSPGPSHNYIDYTFFADWQGSNFVEANFSDTPAEARHGLYAALIDSSGNVLGPPVGNWNADDISYMYFPGVPGGNTYTLRVFPPILDQGWWTPGDSIYSLTMDTPEPSSGLLLCAGALAVMRRRRSTRGT
jgi:hypothetical protein